MFIYRNFRNISATLFNKANMEIYFLYGNITYISFQGNTLMSPTKGTRAIQNVNRIRIPRKHILTHDFFTKGP